MKPLISYHPSLDIWKNRACVYYSGEFEDKTKDDAGRRVWIPLARWIEMIFAQQIVDALSIVALLAYHTCKFSPSELSLTHECCHFLGS